MTIERFGLIQFKGENQTVVGPDITLGQIAPDFIAINQEWSEVRPLTDTRGKVRVLAAVPSLETAVCDRETRRFNQVASGLGNDVHIFVISADLPYTQNVGAAPPALTVS